MIWTGPISWKWSHTGHGGSHIGQGRAATRLLAAATHIPSMEGVPPCKVCRDQFPNSIKSTHPPLPIYDTLVTGMLRPGVGVDGKKCKFANIEGNLEKSVWKSDPADLARLEGQVAKLEGGSRRAAVTKWNFSNGFKMAEFETHTWLNPIPLSFLM